MRLLLLLLVALVPATSAQAATVSLDSDSGAIDEETEETSSLSTASITIIDRLGQVNDLTVRVEGRVVVVTDRAARLTHGKRCTGPPGGAVRCVLPKAEELNLGVDAGAGDDTVRLTGSGPAYTYLGGGEGADRLTGGADSERLYGGPGVDALRGGPGDDELNGDDPEFAANLPIPLRGDAPPPVPSPDTLDGGPGTDQVTFSERLTSVRVDLAERTAAEDVVRSIENAEGGEGDDVLLGDDGPQTFSDIGGDTVDGRGGDDTIEQGAAHVRGGAGDDFLDGTDARSLACGTGVDVVARLARLAPADCEWVYGDSDVVLGRNVLRVRGGLGLRARPAKRGRRDLRLRTEGVVIGRARQPLPGAARAVRAVRVSVRLTPAGRRLVASGRAATLVVSTTYGTVRLRLSARR